PSQSAGSGYINRVTRIVGDDQAVHQLAAAIEPLERGEDGADKGQRLGQRSVVNPHEARLLLERDLELAAEVQSELRVAIDLLGAVVGLRTLPGIISQPEEPFGWVAFEEEPPFQRPPVLAAAPGRVAQINTPRDGLRDGGDRV